MLMIRCTMDSKNYSVKPDKEEVKAITKRMAGLTEELPVRTIAERLVQPYGRTFSPAVFRDNKRTNDTWVSQQLFGLDFDEGISVEEVLERCDNYGILPCFIYSTFSSINNNKFRVFFCNDTEVTDYRVRTLIQLALMRMFRESDKSCKDASRMFYGGKVLLYENYDGRINPVDLLKVLCRYINDTDSTNASREITSYCQQVGLDMVNGLPKMVPMEMVKFEETAGTPIDNVYIAPPSKSSNLIHSFYFCAGNKSNTGTTKAPRKYSVVNEKLERRELIEDFSFATLKENCALWEDFSEAGIRLEHHERMGVATNLLMIKGGRTQFFDALKKWNEQDIEPYDMEKWQYDCNTFVRLNYFPMRCENFCPYEKKCEHTNNMIDQVKLAKGHVRVISTPEVKSLQQAEEELREQFQKALESKEHKIYVIKAPTGIGKTELYLNLENVTIAIPTHNLKDEVSGRMKVKHKVTPKIPDDDRVKYLYSVGSYMMANQYIQKMAKEGKQEYIEYLRKAKDAEVSFGTILTTHDKLLSMKKRNDTIIIDEDIISTLLPVHQTTLDDIETMARECCCIDTIHTLESIMNFAKMAGDGLVYQMPSYGGIKTSKLEEIVNSNDINSNVLGFLNCSHFVRYTVEDTGKVIFHYIVKRELPEKNKIIIMSATANEYICKLMFGDRLEFIDIGQVETKGSIRQYPQRSFSRYQMNKDDNLRKLAKALTQGKPIITYKDYAETFDNVIANFGATAGLDSFKGENIAVIGTPHVNPVTYLLYANALGKKPRLNDTRTSMQYTKVKRNGFEFYFNTFSNDDILQEIQLFLIETELIQAVGRARVLRNDCTVTVLSNLPIQGAEYKYLTKEEFEILLSA